MADNDQMSDRLTNPPEGPHPDLKLTLGLVYRNTLYTYTERKKYANRTGLGLKDAADHISNVIEQGKITEATINKLQQEADKWQKEADENDAKLEKELQEFATKNKAEVDVLKDQSELVKKSNDNIVIDEKNLKTSNDLIVGLINQANVIKLKLKTASTIGAEHKQIISIGAQIHKSASGLSKIANAKGFCAFFNSTVGKAFNYFRKNGIMLGSFLFAAKSIYTVYSWIKNTAMFVIEGIWTILKPIGKLGWSVVSTIFSIVSTPFIKVGTWFGNILNAFLSSPAGWLAITVVLGAVVYFLWDPVKEFLGNAFDGAWNWITKHVNSLMETDDGKKLEITFQKYKKRISTFFVDMWTQYITGDGLKKYYDKNIGPKIGLSGTTISKVFHNGIAAIKKGWNIFIKTFTALHSSNLLDELLVVWSTLKQIYYGSVNPDHYNDAYRNNLVAGDNDKRANAMLQYEVQKQASAWVQSKVIEAYFAKYNGILDADTKANLLKIGSQAFQTFVNSRKIFADSSLNESVLNSINVDVNSIVAGVMGRSTTDLKSAQFAAVDTSRVSEGLINHILSIINSPDFKDPNKASPISQSLNVIINQTTQSVNDTVKADAIHRSSLNNLKNIEGYAQIVFSGLVANAQLNNSLDSTASSFSFDNTLISKNSDVLYQLGDERHALLNTIQNLDRPKALDYVKSFVIKNELNTKLSSQNLKKFVDSVLISTHKSPTQQFEFDFFINDFGILSDPTNTVPYAIPQASGGVITGPIHALIGEAGYPEIIIPVNREGLDFVSKSMNEAFVQPTIDENKQRIDVSKRDVVRRMKTGSKSKADEVMYDMKNFSHSVLGID